MEGVMGSISKLSDREFKAHIQAKRKKRMDLVDSMTKDQRALVYEYGLTVVKAIMDSGVTKPRRIKHIVETVLDEFSPTRGAASTQGIRRADGISPQVTDEHKGKRL
jgi:hypothetical protein